MTLGTAVRRTLMVVGVMAIVGAAAGLVVLSEMIHRGFSARDEPSAVEAFAARRMRLWSVPSTARERRNPLPVTADTLSGARSHWADHCAGCHANDGSGQTPMGKGMYPRPPDMRSELTQRLSDGELYAIIQNGVRLTGMPGWGNVHEEDAESWALVAFIRRLPETTPAELEQMKTLNPRSVHELEQKEEDDFLNQQ